MPFPSVFVSACRERLFCGVILLFAALPRDGVAAQPEHPPAAKTLAEFKAICESLKNSEQEYYGENTLKRLQASLRQPDLSPQQETSIRTAAGVELLELGKPLEAAAAFDRALALMAEPSGDNPAIDASLRRARATTLRMVLLAHLQAAEDENCMTNPGADMCILPLKPAGVHQRPGHARIAGDTALEILKLEQPTPAVVWLLNLARMLSGDHPQGVPEYFRLPENAFKSSLSIPAWTDRAHELGVNVMDLAGAAIMDDFDGDGLLDLISTSAHPCDPMKAFRADGKGGFENVGEEWGLDAQLGGLNAVHADFDNDGDLDILVLRGGWLHADGQIRNSLLRNDTGSSAGHFVDVTRNAGMAAASYPTQTAGWADYDNDGDLDVYVGNEGDGVNAYPSQLFRNNGDGTFTDVAEAAGVVNDRYTKGVSWGDFNNDGHADLYVSTNNSPNRLYRNDGEGKFTDVAPELGVVEPGHRSFATWFFDYNNDGWLDIFVANFGNVPERVMASFFNPQSRPGEALIYRNDGGTFTEVSAELGLNRPHLPMGANYGDLNNDGWLDFYLGTGEPGLASQVPNAMYLNDRGQRFIDVTFAGGFGHLQKGHGVAFGDIDNDGDSDLFHQLGGFYPGDDAANTLFENPGTDAGWIVLELHGIEANRYGVGARLELQITEGEASRSIYLLAGSGGSFGGSSMQQEAGLGQAAKVDRLIIDWPGSGTHQEFSNVTANRAYRILEGDSELEPVDRQRVTLAGRAVRPPEKKREKPGR